MGERFFLPNSVESHSQQQSLHCAAPCGLTAASDVEAERERWMGGGGGGETHAAGQ